MYIARLFMKCFQEFGGIKYYHLITEDLRYARVTAVAQWITRYRSEALLYNFPVNPYVRLLVGWLVRRRRSVIIS